MGDVPSLENIYTSKHFFGIQGATPVQRAICRIAEGLPLGDLANHDDVRAAVGGEEALAILAPGTFRPRELDLLCAIRSGKSFFIAAHQFWSSQIIDVATLGPGEVAGYPVLSVNVKSAEQTFNILAGTMLARPTMKALLAGEVGQDTLVIRHPSGRVVECSVAAGARAGQNVISRWLAGVAFEEYPRQAGEAGGAVVNFDAQLNAAAGRVVEGGQILSVGSPWAPFGPAWERYSTGFGRPSRERVIIKAPGPAMNPTWWTPARCEALRASNPTAFVTDVLAGFADPSSAFIPQSDVKAATRAEGEAVLPPVGGRHFVWAMDPATRGNGWTLVGVGHYRDAEGIDHYDVVLAKEWRGSPIAPLSPGHVLQQIARTIAPYGTRRVHTDQHAADAIRDLGKRVGLAVIIHPTVGGNAPEPSPDRKPPNPNTVYRNDALETMAGIFAARTITIPADRVLTGDLLSVRRVLTRNGVAYDFPSTADGRHCDYVPALGLALSRFPSWDQAQARAAFERKREAFADEWRRASAVTPAQVREIEIEDRARARDARVADILRAPPGGLSPMQAQIQAERTHSDEIYDAILKHGDKDPT